MLKRLLTYYFLLSVLLLSGYSQVIAVPLNESLSVSSNGTQEESDADVIAIPSEEWNLILHTKSPSKEKKPLWSIIEIEEEEDDKGSSKRLLRSSQDSHFFTNISYLDLPAFYFRYIKKGLQLFTHFTHFSSNNSLSYTYIILQVIRI